LPRLGKSVVLAATAVTVATQPRDVAALVVQVAVAARVAQAATASMVSGQVLLQVAQLA
jgi:hypothetical protein